MEGNPGLAASGGIFRDYMSAALGCFAVNIGNYFAIHAELIGATMGIELTFNKGRQNLWLECDSS